MWSYWDISNTLYPPYGGVTRGVKSLHFNIHQQMRFNTTSNFAITRWFRKQFCLCELAQKDTETHLTSFQHMTFSVPTTEPECWVNTHDHIRQWPSWIIENDNVGKHIEKNTLNNLTSWDLTHLMIISDVEYNLNTLPADATGHSPFEILYGAPPRRIPHPMDRWSTLYSSILHVS